MFVAVMTGTTIPTPIYVFWARQFGYSAIVTPFIFAVYAVGVLVALLFAGGVSDQVGRRPALMSTVVLSLLSSITFVLADGLPVLFVGRFVSGLAAGVVTGAATAMLTDLAGPRRPRLGSVGAGAVNVFGLGLGPLLGGLLAEYAPGPTTLPFEAHLALSVLAGLVLLALPETAPRRETRPDHRRLVRFRGLGVPGEGRRIFVAAAAAALLTFALVGIFTALVPTFLGETLHQRNDAVVGGTIMVLFATSTIAQVVAGLLRAPRRPTVRVGLLVLVASLGVVVAGLGLPSYLVFVVGTAMAGVASALTFYGSLATALAVAPPARRGQVTSAYFVAAYVGLTVPIVGLGIGTVYFGPFAAVLVGAIVISVLALTAFAGLRPGAGE